MLIDIISIHKNSHQLKRRSASNKVKCNATVSEALPFELGISAVYKQKWGDDTQYFDVRNFVERKLKMRQQ